MKGEMFKFIYQQATGHEINYLSMRAPHGQTVYGPRKLAFMDRPYMEGYKTYPELSRRGGPGTYYVLGTAAAVTAVALPFAVATAKYPDVSGPQYQSAMSGQMGIGSSALNMRKTKKPSDFFTWSYWQGY
jgi:hypothetical protein